METDLEENRRNRDEALGRVVEIWLNDERDPEELDKALDVLTLAHTKANFDFCSQSFYFRLPWERFLKAPKPESE
jgi:hypothetical protein